MRALRVDKLTYAALEGTLLDYLAGRALDTIPVVRMLTATTESLEERARAVTDAVGTAPGFDIEIQSGTSMVGGGSAPGIGIETRLIALRPRGQAGNPAEAGSRMEGKGHIDRRGRARSAPANAVPTAASELEAALRAADPPVIARVEQETVLLDLRTVAPEQDEIVARVLRRL
jgi:L-seryl-tRNA(Ser) seleniumtransferase